MSVSEPCSSDEAREQADFHRRELNDTLDKIGHRLHRTIEGAEERITRPVMWVRHNPWAAMGIAVALGFLMTGGRKGHQSARHRILTRELEAAYLDGRRDEQQGAALKETSHWRQRKLDLQAALAPDAPSGILPSLTEAIVRAAVSALTRLAV
ncbi:MAG: hypothetical protein ACYCQK_00805 [Acidiferrobacteraceae bacterium]